MQTCVCNSLKSLFPSVAAEFDVAKNGFAPSEVTAQSNQKVWWRNAQRGSWRQAVYARTYAGHAAGVVTFNSSASADSKTQHQQMLCSCCYLSPGNMNKHLGIMLADLQKS